MKIWWCQEHEASGEDVSCVYAHWNDAEGHVGNMPPCRMVPMRLIPDNPDWPALEMAMRAHLYEDEAADSVLVVKDWLAALDGETP